MQHRPFRISLPLRHHLVIMVVGVLLPLLVFSIIVVRQLAQSQRAADERRIGESASELANTFDREVAGTFRSLDTLAQSNFLQQNDLPRFYEDCRRVLAVQPSWTTIILTDATGTPVINLHVPYGRTLPPISDTPSMQECLNTLRPTVGTLKFAKGYSLAFPVRVAVLQQSKLRYILTAVITAESLKSLVARHAATTDEWTRTVVDSGGTIAARTRGPERFVGKAATPAFIQRAASAESGLFPNTSLEGTAVYVAYTHTSLGHWTASIVVPAAVLDGPSRRSLLIMSAIGAGLLLITTACAFLLSLRLGRGIASAAGAAEALASGKRPVVYPSRIREVTQLSESLLRSADLLNQQEVERNDLLMQANVARAEAEDASHAKDEFLAMLGHELRNPLGPMRTGVHLLAVLPAGDPRIEPTRQTIERQTEHMARIVDDLLDASRIRQHKFEVHRELVDFRALVDNVAADMRPQLARSDLALHLTSTDREVYVQGDRTRLAQAIGNVLHNAAKFTPDGGTIDITLAVDADHATLAIRDDGIGIDPAFMPSLFRPFAQGPQRLDRPHGGLGLGLALVKGFIEAHGGSISAASDGLGKGSTFTLRLPTTSERPAPTPAASAQPRPPHRRILLIEDMHDAARTLKLLLSLDGHTIEIAHSGSEALTKAVAFSPNVVLCDIGLPDIDGYTLCGMLQDLPEAANARYIALTGYGQSADIDRALAAGFHLHLIKPVDIPRLRVAVMQSTGDVPESVPAR